MWHQYAAMHKAHLSRSSRTETEPIYNKRFNASLATQYLDYWVSIHLHLIHR
jgi:hypothetical protein